ncbi:sulfotransferase domain-containing protein [Mesorhizobium sp. 10J20-29]
MRPSIKRARSRLASVLLRSYLRAEARRGTCFVVCGYPKSGTTWVTQLIGQVSGLTYHQNNVRFRTCGVVLHTHSTLFEGRARVLYVVRDPRETICSAARAMRAAGRSDVFSSNGRIDDEFVRFAITRLPGARHSLRNHLQRCITAGWYYVRFEDLKADTTGCVSRIVDHYGFGATEDSIRSAVERFDFSSLKRRNISSPFLAQSSVSSWTGLLTKNALDILRSHCADQAEAFGYTIESD